MNSSRLNQAGRIPRAAKGAGVALLVAELCLTVQFLTVLSLTVLSLTVLWPGSVLAYDNYGLGPLTIRNQFPPSLKYLSYHPETTQTIGEGLFQFSYQFNRTNTFINSQSPRLKRNKQSGIIIDQDVVEAGLDASNFPANGYGMYLDMEADLNMFRFTYGLGERSEVGMDISWLNFYGGWMDERITLVEKAFGGLNKDRNHSDINRFDYYVYRDGEQITATSEAPHNLYRDPVFRWKWNITEGYSMLPAWSIKMAVKPSLNHNPDPVKKLALSGGSDWGWYSMFSKSVGDVVGHLQFGHTYLSPEPNTYASKIRHKLFGMEFRLDAQNSFIVQSVTQSSVFELRKSMQITDENYGYNFIISRPTDVSIWGIIHRSETFRFETGFIEDYYQQRNEADITFYMEMGWIW